MIKKAVLIASYFIVLQSNILYGYDDQVTHPEITRKAASDVSNLNAYLKTSLGFSTGLDSHLPSDSTDPNRTILKLLTGGSTAEDYPLCRATNHFHNPLKSWDRAGISTISWPLCPSWDVTSYSTRHSALTWATGFASYNGPIINRTNQQMGWDYARDDYYSAMISNNNTAREDYFAKTFQSVGQVMHLLQDMAVPAHVRNDFWNSHVWTGGANPYELYVKNHSDLITNLTKEQITGVMPAFTSARQTDYWDTSDGSVIVPVQILDPSFQSKAGLSEFTNANFVSEGTLFSNSTEFEYPKKSSTVEVVYNIPDPFSPGATVKRPY